MTLRLRWKTYRKVRAMMFIIMALGVIGVLSCKQPAENTTPVHPAIPPLETLSTGDAVAEFWQISDARPATSFLPEKAIVQDISGIGDRDSTIRIPPSHYSEFFALLGDSLPIKVIENAEEEEMYCFWIITIKKSDGSKQNVYVYTTGPAIVYMVRGGTYITDRAESEVLGFFKQFQVDENQ